MNAFWLEYARIGNLTLGAILFFGFFGGILDALNRYRLISDFSFLALLLVLVATLLYAWIGAVFGL